MTLSVCADSALKLSCSVLMCLFFFHCINNSARKTFHLLMMSQKKINSFSGLCHRQRGLTFTLHSSGLDSVFGFFWLLLSCSLRVNCGSFSHPKSNVGFVFVFLSTSLGWLCTTVPKKRNLQEPFFVYLFVLHWKPTIMFVYIWIVLEGLIIITLVYGFMSPGWTAYLCDWEVKPLTNGTYFNTAAELYDTFMFSRQK